jgi:hypothetical protein
MTLKIERDLAGRLTTLHLIGRLRSEDLGALEQQMTGFVAPVLDLASVTLVDVDVVRFLGSCESDGVTLLHCPPYVREWIRRERQ